MLFVGGNHDVSWTAALPTDEPHARHRTFADTFRDDPHPHLEAPAEARRLDQSTVLLREARVASLLLGSAEVGGEVTVDPTRRALLKILDTVPAGALDVAQQAEADALRTAVHADPIRDRLATLLRGVSTLNTKTRDEVDKLRDEVERIDPGMVHHRVLDAVAAFRWPDSTPVRIAVLHHPVSPLPVTEVAAFAGLVNAGRVKSTLLDAGFTLVLHGHAHRGWFSVERWPTAHGDRTLHIAAAPSLSSHEVSEKHGYNEIVVTPPLAHREGDDVAVHVVVRRRVHDGGNWALDGASLDFTVPERVARAT